jgi:predicted N-acyltransferase
MRWFLFIGESLLMPSDKMTIRQARAALREQDEGKRQAVLDELEALAAAEITDVLSWDNAGRVTFKDSAKLSARARKAVKKVRVTATAHGNNIELEMHDKLPALRLLAKHRGLLEVASDLHRPSLIGINLKGPEVTTYEVVDDDDTVDR